MAGLPFTALQVDNTDWPLEPMSSTVNPPNTGNGVSFRVPCIHLTDRVESGTAGIDLIQIVQRVSGTITIQSYLFGRPVSRAMSKMVCQLLV